MRKKKEKWLFLWKQNILQQYVQYYLLTYFTMFLLKSIAAFILLFKSIGMFLFIYLNKMAFLKNL